MMWIILVCICIASAVHPISSLDVSTITNGEIETYFEDIKLQGIPFRKRVLNQSTTASISFRVTSETTVSMLSFKWYRNDVELKVTRYDDTIPSKPGSIFSTESGNSTSLNVTLYLRKRELIPGEYTLSVSMVDNPSLVARSNGFVASAPVLPVFSKERRVLEGDRLNVFCEVIGYPKPSQVIWRFAHIKQDMMDDQGALTDAEASLTVIDTNSSVYTFITNSVLRDQLVFNELPSEFNGLYECSVAIENTTDQTLFLINVKDRWAALWPFIGIVVEVSVLVTAILLYERHQLRSKGDVNAAGAGDITSPSTKTSAVQQQQNNLSAQTNAADPAVGVVNKTEIMDEKHDEIRQRGVVQC